MTAFSDANATKGDLRELETRLESHFREMFATKADLRELETRLESHFREMFATKVDLYQMETRITRWTVGAVMGSIGAAAAITFTIARLVS